jgi:predicted dehydrogenase/threonine dehydrogenase-like Zn-dependent dehydrogenase
MRGADLKGLLNDRANAVFARREYTDRMLREAKREGWWWLRERARAARRRAPLVSGWTVVWSNLGRAELVPFDVAAAGPGEVTIEVLASVISPGTERAQYLGLANSSMGFPGRPGYSACGVVRHVGAGVAGLRPGDLVATAAVPHASVATIRAADAYPVPAGLDAAAAATVALGVIAALGVERGGPVAGRRACVVGAGPIGLLAQRLARAAGARATAVVATSPRAADAVARGGGRLVLAGDLEAVADLRCEVVIEATGDATALATAVAAGADGARIVLLGSARGGTARLPVEAIQGRGITLAGAHIDLLALRSRRGAGDERRRTAEAYLRALADGAVDVADLVGEAIDPREADAHYRRLAARATTALRFDWSALPPSMHPRRGRVLRPPDLAARGVEPRRSTLRAASTGPLALPDPFAGAEGGLRVALLGCGDIALQNASAAVQAPNVSLVGCFDPVPHLAGDLARRFGGDAAGSAEQLLARPDVDAVMISTPHDLHVPLALQAIAAGKHVIVEKPLAESLAPAIEAVEAAERAGVHLTTMYVARYEPRAIVARRLIERGAIGRPLGMSLTFLTDKPLSYWHSGASGRSRGSWRGVRERSGGGVLMMNLCHCVDLVRWLIADEAEEVLAAQVGSPERPGVEDGVALTVRYAGGALGSFVGSTVVPGVWEERPATSMHVWGTDGHLQLEPHPAVYTRRAIDGLRTGRWHAFPRLPSISQRAVFLSRFATSLARGEEPEVTPGDALAVQRLIDAAYEAADAPVARRGEPAREVVS